ncbi:MAG: GTPase-activating protein [Icmadophila ericetorum]|nr:GTPase-activating protein [Icmadophila ericetorum]
MNSKKPLQQEMVQVGSSSSPFWNRRPSTGRQGSGKNKAYDPNVVVGASYSHTDMLKFESLNISSSSSRPQTPPTANSRSGSRNAHLPLSGRSSGDPSLGPSRPAHMGSLSNRDWSADDEDDGLDVGASYDYSVNENEDEFGLPSIATSRRQARRAAENNTKSSVDSRNLFTSGAPSLGAGLSSTRPRANSSDIAEERGPPSYPTARESEGKILRPQYKDILRDPANALHLITHPTIPPTATAKESDAHNSRISRINKFKRILQASSISLADLRSSAWSGIPGEARSMSWQVLLGYLPTSSERRVATLERKRKEYLDGIKQVFSKAGPSIGSPAGKAKSASSQGRSRGLDENVWHQISIDVPRTSPHIELYSYEATQRSLERILYLWAVRHPASGYVQGINDLVTPFWQVFLGTYITDPNIESGMDPGQLPRPVLDAVEADAFWCLTKLLDGIQDNYIFAQPGIVRQVSALRDLTTRIDGVLAKHLEKEGVEFMQFSFRWMNCLLMREFNIKCTIRMWDTYMAEEQGFSDFHLYVCAAFLVKWTDQLVKKDFQEVMMFLQALPTREWTEKDIELLLSEAFIWQSLFRGSSAHLRNSSSSVPSLQ